ncbi:MAG: polysaccharide biosynthesis protein [Clostridia bacterium]|jgi:stage V sporulation protein B
MESQSVGKGFTVLAFAGIAVKIMSLLYIPFLLNIIGDYGNGIYAASYQVYVLIYALSNAGMPSAISKLVSELIAVGNRRDAIRTFKIARFMLIIFGIAMALFMFLFARTFANLLQFKESYLAILALSPTLLFTSISSSYRGYFQGQGNMTPTAISQVIEQIVNTIFTLVFASLLIRYGVVAACAGGTIGTSLGALSSAVFLVIFHKRHNSVFENISQNISKIKRFAYGQLVKKILSYSVPITMSIGLQYTGNLIDLGITKSRLLVAGISNVEATQMYSHLNKYQQLLNAPLSIVVALAVTILPAIAAAVALKDKVLISSRINLAFRLSFMVTIPSAVGFSVLSGPIFKVLGYGSGSYLMMFGSFALVFLAIVQIQTSIQQASGKLFTVTLILMMGIIGKIITDYIAISIREINISGAVIGSIIGYLISILLNNYFMKKNLQTDINLLKLAKKPIYSSIFMGIIVFISYNLSYVILGMINSLYARNAISAVIAIFMGIISYFFAMIKLRGISKEEIDSLPRAVLRIIPKRIVRKIT